MGFEKYDSKRKQNNEVKYEVVEHFGKLGESESGWCKELNLISWNGNPAKFDIRAWKDTETGRQMQKGITLSADEAAALLVLFQKIAEEK